MANISGNATHGNQELGVVLESILTDLTALKTAVDAIVTKLNADSGVTDTNYAAVSTLVTTK